MNENSEKAINEFSALGQQRLNNHLLELKTMYGGERPESDDLLRRGYEDHRRIFEQELEEKKKQLSGNENPWLSGEIDKIKQGFIERFDMEKNKR